MDSYYAFNLGGPRYDGEAKELRTDLTLFRKELAKEYTRTKEYVGSNAFGATTKASETDVAVYCMKFAPEGVALDFAEKWSFKWNSNVRYPCGTSRAKSILKTLRVFAICKIKEPFTDYDRKSGGTPTITDPNRYDYNFYSVTVDILEFWFVDSASGEIYFKQRGIFLLKTKGGMACWGQRRSKYLSMRNSWGQPRQTTFGPLLLDPRS